MPRGVKSDAAQAKQDQPKQTKPGPIARAAGRDVHAELVLPRKPLPEYEQLVGATIRAKERGQLPDGSWLAPGETAIFTGPKGKWFTVIDNPNAQKPDEEAED